MFRDDYISPRHYYFRQLDIFAAMMRLSTAISAEIISPDYCIRR
jgi:hypothetical protein